MVFHQITPFNVLIACDIPLLTAGVPSYPMPAIIEISKNGGVPAGLSGMPGTVTAVGDAWVIEVLLDTGDVDTIGSMTLLAMDVGGNLVGKLNCQVIP